MQGNVTSEEKALQLIRKRGIVRSRDFQDHGISREMLRCLRERGRLVQSGRGIYLSADAPLTEHHSLVEATSRRDMSAICVALS